jgi:hypothetical protein
MAEDTDTLRRTIVDALHAMSLSAFKEQIPDVGVDGTNWIPSETRS